MIDPITDAKTQLQDVNSVLASEIVPLQQCSDLVATMLAPVQTSRDALATLQSQLSTVLSSMNSITAPLVTLEQMQPQLSSLLQSAMAPVSVAQAKVKAAIADLNTAIVSVDRTGSVDVTAGIQSYLNKAGSIYIPAGKYLIDAEVSLNVLSNTDLVLDDEAYLIVKPNSNHHYKVFLLHAVNNVTITGGHLVGDRDAHTYTPVYLKDGTTLSSLSTHEWGHGIGIGGGDNITIRGVEMSGFTGDGISVGSNHDVTPWARATNVLIDGVDSHDNRRQGLSITNVNGIKVINSKFRRIGLGNGTSPKCGIDIEPDNDPNSTEAGTCDNVWIENCLIADNALYGLNIFNRVSDITIKGNRFVTNNSCGAVVVDGVNINFVGNTYDHNKATGLFIKDGVDSFKVDGETFILNYQNQNPVARAKPVSLTGYQNTTQCKRDLLITTVALPKGTVGTCSYS